MNLVRFWHEFIQKLWSLLDKYWIYFIFIEFNLLLSTILRIVFGQSRSSDYILRYLPHNPMIYHPILKIPSWVLFFKVISSNKQEDEFFNGKCVFLTYRIKNLQFSTPFMRWKQIEKSRWKSVEIYKTKSREIYSKISVKVWHIQNLERMNTKKITSSTSSRKLLEKLCDTEF